MAYHSLDRLVHLTDSILEDDGYRLLLFILLDDPIEQLPRLLPVLPLLQCQIAAELTILIDDSQANDLVAIIDQLIDQPLESELRVIILIGAAQERAGSPVVRIVSVLGLQREREIGCILIVEGIEGDTLQERAAKKSTWEKVSPKISCGMRMTVLFFLLRCANLSFFEGMVS